MQRLLVLVALTIFCAEAGAAEIVEANPLATAVIVVAPEFPKEARPSPDEEVKIEVRGTVTALGEFKPARFVHEPGQEAYARAVQAVLRYWRFKPAIDGTQCVPTESEATLYVWFQMKEGEPKVFVSMPGKTQSPKATSKLLFHVRPDIRYPRAAQLKGVEGESVVLLQVVRTGEVTRREIRSQAAMPEFDAAALKGFERVTLEPFDPAEFGGKQSLCVEYEVEFCLSGRGRTALQNLKCRRDR